jgi:hypothetical protein
VICDKCKVEFEKWQGNSYFGEPLNSLCLKCNDRAWKEFEKEEADNLKKIEALQSTGHSHHCACRQVWGDGECECDMYAKGYDPYAWIALALEQ